MADQRHPRRTVPVRGPGCLRARGISPAGRDGPGGIRSRAADLPARGEDADDGGEA